MTTIIPMFPPPLAALKICPAEERVLAPPSATVVLFDAEGDDDDFEPVPESSDVEEFCKDTIDAAETVKQFAVTAAALLAMSRAVMVRFVADNDLADALNLHRCLADRVLEIDGLNAVFGEARRRLAIAVEAAQKGGAS
jgi:hypothetical protein